MFRLPHAAVVLVLVALLGCGESSSNAGSTTGSGDAVDTASAPAPSASAAASADVDEADDDGENLITRCNEACREAIHLSQIPEEVGTKEQRDKLAIESCVDACMTEDYGDAEFKCLADAKDIDDFEACRVKSAVER